MSSNKLTDAEARQLLEMTKKSLVQEINFPTRGNEKEFDVVGDTKKDVFAIKIYRGKIQPFKYNIGARIKKNGTMMLELHISPSNVHYNPNGEKICGSHWHIYTEEYFIANGQVLPDAFQFDKDVREDGYREMSINWNDCEKALTIALNQKKENGKLQFKGGIANLKLSLVELILSDYIRQGQFSYERREVEGNPYHGNLLVSHTLDKKIRSLISNGLALAAGTNITYQLEGME